MLYNSKHSSLKFQEEHFESKTLIFTLQSYDKKGDNQRL